MSRQALAKAMRDRRGELGLSVVDAVAGTGEPGSRVARSTWRELEQGVRTRLTAPVGARIDKVLGWEVGAALDWFYAPEPSAEERRAMLTEAMRDRQRPRLVSEREPDYTGLLASQLEAINARLSTLEAPQSHSAELLAAWQRLGPADQRTVLDLIRRLAPS